MKRKYSAKLLNIAIPIMISDLISQLQMLIDRIFLGRLDIKCMSAVGNASSPMWTTMSVIFSLTIGSTILVSQAIGAGDKESAKSITNSMFKYNNVFSVILTIFWFTMPEVVFRIMGVDESIIGMSVDYAKIYAPVFIITGIGASVSSTLQVCEKTKIMIYYGVVRSTVNIILDWALIFGNMGMPRMEVKGAAIATTIAEVIGSVIILVYIFWDKEIWLKPSIREILDARPQEYIKSIKLGIPSAAEDFSWNFGQLYLLTMLNHVSIEAAGVYSIIFGAECIPIVVAGSIGRAVLTLSGQETGKKNHSGIWDVSLEAMQMCIGIAAFVVVMVLLFPQTIMGWFTTDASVIAAAGVYLMIVAIDLFPKSGNIIFGSGIKGYGDTKWMLWTQIIGTVFIVITSSIFVLVFHMGMAQIFCIVVADETLRCVINYWKLTKISGRRLMRVNAE